MAKIIFMISIVLLSSYLTEQTKLSYDTVDTEINNLRSGGNVYLNPAEKKHLKLLETGGVEDATKLQILYAMHKVYNSTELMPKEFDARKRWPQCKTIGEVYNDGNSDLSWAYATTGTFTDRMCIATNGKYHKLLSTEELISCSGIKSNLMADDHSWQYFESHGLVSGGKYNTNDGCQPSKFPSIFNLPTNISKRTCDRTCYGNSLIDYNHDHVRVSHSYHILYKNIQKEVQTYGPVSAYFQLYDDLFLHKTGVYEKSKNAKFIRYQMAKLIGWGVENGVDYWLLVNSWGYEWGQNGLFKIRRGTNECSIDNLTSGGVPKI